LREVTLEGEAYFEVVKDSEHPFIIHTKVVDVKVLGTEFNVKAYPDDKVTETSLIRGSVELTVKNRNNEKIYLKPNEKIVVLNSSIYDDKSTDLSKTRDQPAKEIFSVQPINFNQIDSTIIETSWVQNKLVFQEKETFKDLAVKMERWYGVQIIFENEQLALANAHVFGSFTTETISEALHALKEIFKFNYKINGNVIIISS
jgi:ferric-dicitrate binding protein FerR (iron transport regulator)